MDTFPLTVNGRSVSEYPDESRAVSAQDNIRRADDTFYDVFSNFRLLRYVNPVNWEKEKETFFEAWDSNQVYQPKFEYDALPSGLSQWIRALEGLSFGVSPLENCFAKARDELLATLQLVEARGSTMVTEKSIQVFGKVDPVLVKEGDALMKERQPKRLEPQTEMGIKALATAVRDRIREARIDGWDVVEDPGIVPWAETDWTDRKIRLRPGMVLGRDMIDRLLHHLIEVHVYRAVNGSRQPYRAFVVGLDQFAETEEGLAVELEDRLGLLKPSVRRLYGGRVIAVHLAAQQSFFDIFRKLVEFFSPEDAYTLTERSKRGLTDTSEPGGFLRDHIYLQGKKRIKLLTTAELRLLYTGKIAVHHIRLVKEMLAQHQLIEPAFFPSVLNG
jgi:hypothetical protein